MNLLALTESEVIWPAMGQKVFRRTRRPIGSQGSYRQQVFYRLGKIIAPRARTKKIGYIHLFFAGPGRYKDGSASTPLMGLYSKQSRTLSCARA